MSGISHEDAQPNEIRMGSKGSSTVPTIRMASPTRGSYRGRGFRGRGRGRFHPSTYPTQSLPVRPQYNNTHVTSSQHPPFPAHNMQSSLPKRPYPFPNHNVPPKRPRHDTHPMHPVNSAQGPTEPCPMRRRKAHANLITETLDIELPEECRKGVEGSKRQRQRWITEQLPKVERERSIKALNHSFFDDSVRLTYRRLHASEVLLTPLQMAHPVLPPSSPVNSMSIRSHPIVESTQHESKEPTVSDGIPPFTSRRLDPSMEWPLPTGKSPPFYPSSTVLDDRPPEPIINQEAVVGAQKGVDCNVCMPCELVIQDTECRTLPALHASTTSIFEPPRYSCFPFRSGTLVISKRDNINPGEPASHDLDNAFLSTNSEFKEVVPEDNMPLVPPSSPMLQSLEGRNSLRPVEGRPENKSFLIEPMDNIIRLPKDNHEKPRRLLTTSSLGLISVTSRGAAHLASRQLSRQPRSLLAGIEASGELVEDACLLEDSYLVVGFGRDSHQLSIYELEEGKVKSFSSFDPPPSIEKKSGISAVTAMLQPCMFASGGYDHRIHLWTIPEDVFRTSPQYLPIKHSSQIQSLLCFRDTSSKLMSASADCTVNLWDLSSLRVVNTLKASNSVYHVHPTMSPFCTLLEVAHRELQFEIRDHRLVPEKAVQRFGYVASKFHGRYVKGDVKSSVFACGDRDGRVRLWDMRNVEEPSSTVSCFPERRILQAVFDDSDLVACSEDHHLAFMKYHERLDPP